MNVAFWPCDKLSVLIQPLLNLTEDVGLCSERVGAWAQVLSAVTVTIEGAFGGKVGYAAVQEVVLYRSRKAYQSP